MENPRKIGLQDWERVDSIMNSLSVKYGVKLIKAKELDETNIDKFGISSDLYVEHNKFIDTSMVTMLCVENDMRTCIINGIYVTPEYTLLGFLHELGHVLDETETYDEMYPLEMAAWLKAFEIAKDLNIDLSIRAYKTAHFHLGFYTDCHVFYKDEHMLKPIELRRKKSFYITKRAHVISGKLIGCKILNSLTNKSI